MAGKVLKMNNMRKINNSAIMNKSAKKPPLLIHVTVGGNLNKKEIQ